MIRLASLLVMSIALLATGCSKPLPTSPVSVADVLSNVHAWNGGVVSVDGWLGLCEGYDCAIYPDEKSARVNPYSDAARDLKSLPIGSSNGFDARAVRLQYTHVVVKARVSDRCFPHKCTDRADILQPIDIRPAPSK